LKERREIWGDDPGERDADATIAELGEAEERGERPWHHRWVIFPFKVVLRFIGRNAKRVGITIAGFAVLLAGLVLSLPLVPGPGFLLILAGLAILATEYVWAQRMLNFAKRKAVEAKDKVLRKKDAKVQKNEAGRGIASGDQSEPPS